MSGKPWDVLEEAKPWDSEAALKREEEKNAPKPWDELEEVHSPEKRQKKGIGLLNQAALGAIESSRPALIGSAITKLMKGAAMNAFAEEQESDRFLNEAFGLGLPELSTERFNEQLQEAEKQSPFTPSGLTELAGIDTTPEGVTEELARGAGFGAGIGNKATGIGKAAAIGAVIPQLAKILPEEAQSVLQDIGSLVMPFHEKVTARAPKQKVVETLPDIKDQALPSKFKSDYEAGKAIADSLSADAPPSIAQQKADLLHQRQMEGWEKRRATAEKMARQNQIKEILAREEAEHQQGIEQNVRNFNETLESISPEPPRSMLQMGREIARDVQERADTEYRRVNAAYETAKNEQSQIFGHRQALEHPLELFIREYENFPPTTLSSAQNKALNFARGVRQMIARGEEISNGDLIKLEQSLNNIMQYDIKPHPTGVFAPIKRAISREIRTSSTPEQYRPYADAKRLNSEWQDTFANEVIEPWRDRSKRQHDVMAKRSLSTASHLAELANALSPQRIPSVLKTAISDALSDAVKKNTPEKYQENLRNISDALPPALSRNLERFTPREKPPSNAENTRLIYNYPEKPPQPIKISSKAPEAIAKKLYSVSGIKELEARLGKNSEALKEAKRYAATQVMTEGRIPSEINFESLRETLKKTEKRAVLRELVGEESLAKMDELVALEERVKQNATKKGKISEQNKAILGSMGSIAAMIALGAVDVPFLIKSIYIAQKANEIVKAQKAKKQK